MERLTDKFLPLPPGSAFTGGPSQVTTGLPISQAQKRGVLKVFTFKSMSEE